MCLNNCKYYKRLKKSLGEEHNFAMDAMEFSIVWKSYEKTIIVPFATYAAKLENPTACYAILSAQPKVINSVKEWGLVPLWLCHQGPPGGEWKGHLTWHQETSGHLSLAPTPGIAEIWFLCLEHKGLNWIASRVLSRNNSLLFYLFLQYQLLLRIPSVQATY